MSPYRTPGEVDDAPMTIEAFERIVYLDVTRPLRLSPKDFYSITKQLAARVELDGNGLEFFLVFTPMGVRRVEVRP